MVDNLKDFTQALEHVDASAIYNHVHEARIRDRLGRSDFEVWLEDVHGLSELASKIGNVDTYMYSLERLREKLIELCREALQNGT